MLKGGVSRANAELLVAALSPSPLPSPSRERGFAGCCWIRGGCCSFSPSPLPSPSKERGFAGCCWIRGWRCSFSPSPQPSPSRERGFCWLLLAFARGRCGVVFHPLPSPLPLPCPLPRGRGGLLAAAGFAGGAAVFHRLPCPLPRGRGGLLAPAGMARGGALQLFTLSPALSLEGEGVCWLLLDSWVALADAWLAQRQGLWGCQGGGGGELDSHQLLVGHAVVLPLALIADLDELVGGHGHNAVEA